MNFTDQIAEYIDQQQLDLKHLTIVLPSERAKKYIASSLYRRFGRPVLAPEMVTVDRWIKELSTRTIIDRTRLLVKLYEVQREYSTDPKDQSFDEFMTWGTILLSDFDEMDRYLLSSKMVFKNLADVKDLENWEVDNWSFGKKELSEGQKRFMEFWDRLPVYYNALNEKLDREKLCYMGKAYREVAENIDLLFKKDKKRQFLFAGFNALSPAETAIMKQLFRMGRGHILVDADVYYLENSSHEAGRFIRRLKSDLELNELNGTKDLISKGKKQITVIECAQHTGQVKTASTILEDLDPEQIDNTLLMLADESLILPLLKNLPRKIGKANITLGLPLRDSAIRTWVDLLFSVQENKSRFGNKAMYFYDLQKFWNHPFITAVLSDADRQRITELEQQLIRNNIIHVKLDRIPVGNVHDLLIELLQESWDNDWKKALHNIRTLNDQLFRSLEKEDAFEKALIQGFDNSLQEFTLIVQEGLPGMSLRSFRHLFHQHWSNKSIAYHGNPIKGLQIMGLLETRLLDFERIIVLGLNEGKMPPTNPIQTMIPMDLRAYFGLPTPRDKQGLFAHHFYRLLHQCSEMWITYTSARETIGSNEASRYLLQLELELARANPEITIKRQFYSIPNHTGTTESFVSVEKTPEVISRMDELFANSVSASSVNKYLKCPLDFYYRFVLEFGEEDTLEEEVESNTLGTFIHNVLEQLFTPFARHDKERNPVVPAPRNITPQDIDAMLARCENLITEQFKEHFGGDRNAYASGKNFLSKEMAVELTRRVLQEEKRFLVKQSEKVFIEYLEVDLRAEVEIEVGGSVKKIRMKGIIDRIDSIGGSIRIVDYKSGKAGTDDVRMKKMPQDEDYRSFFASTKHAVQLAWYCFLYNENFGKFPDRAGILSLVNASSGILDFGGKDADLDEIMAVFPVFLSQLVNEIYNTTMPFIHESGYYSYCNYCE